MVSVRHLLGLRHQLVLRRVHVFEVRGGRELNRNALQEGRERRKWGEREGGREGKREEGERRQRREKWK